MYLYVSHCHSSRHFLFADLPFDFQTLAATTQPVCLDCSLAKFYRSAQLITSFSGGVPPADSFPDDPAFSNSIWSIILTFLPNILYLKVNLRILIINCSVTTCLPRLRLLFAKSTPVTASSQHRATSPCSIQSACNLSTSMCRFNLLHGR